MFSGGTIGIVVKLFALSAWRDGGTAFAKNVCLRPRSASSLIMSSSMRLAFDAENGASLLGEKV